MSAGNVHSAGEPMGEERADSQDGQNKNDAEERFAHRRKDRDP